MISQRRIRIKPLLSVRVPCAAGTLLMSQSLWPHQGFVGHPTAPRTGRGDGHNEPGSVLSPAEEPRGHRAGKKKSTVQALWHGQHRGAELSPGSQGCIPLRPKAHTALRGQAWQEQFIGSPGTKSVGRSKRGSRDAKPSVPTALPCSAAALLRPRAPRSLLARLPRGHPSWVR